MSVPETEFVSGVEVSRVLLEECDTDTVDLLMDVSGCNNKTLFLHHQIRDVCPVHGCVHTCK